MPRFRRKLHLACASDDARYEIEYIYFKDGYAIATDGHILIKQSLRYHGFNEKEYALLDGYFIHRKVFKTIYRKKIIQVDDGLLVLGNGIGIKLSHPDSTPVLKGYPNYEEVINKAMVSNEQTPYLNIEMDNIARIARLSINKYRYTFHFHGKEKAISIKSFDWNERHADEIILLMPIRDWQQVIALQTP